MRPRLVELVGAVGRLAEQHERRVADQVEQGLTVVGALVHRRDRRTQCRDPGGDLVASGGRRACRPRGPQQVAHLLVGGLGEVPVVLADGEER
jgi:hypothetical protein